MYSKIQKKRSVIILSLIFCVFFLFLINLFNVQIVNAKQIRESALETVEREIIAERGEILDRNGNLLVTNKQVNTIVFDYMSFPKKTSERNEIIYALITLFDQQKTEFEDELPIIINEKGKLVFDGEKDSEISYLKSSAFLDLNHYATVQNCFDALVERYELEEYNVKIARKIASVYYSMVKNGFNKTTTYEFAIDVSSALVSLIKEKNDIFIGVDVQISSERSYIYPELAPHVIGLVSPITSEQYNDKKEDGYTMNDDIGQSGIEYTYEQQLRGESGKMLITKNSNGEISTEVSQEPTAGNSVVLTIDKEMQLIGQKALEETILKLQETRDYTISGAVIVMDISSNEVLTSASYPSYDMDEYKKDATKLNNDPTKPLWNRALKSVYTPGSSIKPIVALAGLEEGVIDADTFIKCQGIYRYYKDYQPGCMDYHGNMNVVNAIYHSCNIFFYETARLLGIEKLNDYFTMFGLGESTGIELTENVGTVDSVELRDSRGELWTPGLTIQAGIGHGDNLFTPVQLCSYVSTLANKGVRYNATLIKSIKSFDYSQTIFENTPEILSSAEFSQEHLDLVYQGMLKVGTQSYADFSKVPVDVAAKTGTATVEKMMNGKMTDIYNGFIVAFAPYDDPQIAVAVAIEGSGSGGSAAPVASAVMQYYFEHELEKEDVQIQGDILV